MRTCDCLRYLHISDESSTGVGSYLCALVWICLKHACVNMLVHALVFVCWYVHLCKSEFDIWGMFPRRMISLADARVPQESISLPRPRRPHFHHQSSLSQSMINIVTINDDDCSNLCARIAWTQGRCRFPPDLRKPWMSLQGYDEDDGDVSLWWKCDHCDND